MAQAALSPQAAPEEILLQGWPEVAGAEPSHDHENQSSKGITSSFDSKSITGSVGSKSIASSVGIERVKGSDSRRKRVGQLWEQTWRELVDDLRESFWWLWANWPLFGAWFLFLGCTGCIVWLLVMISVIASSSSGSACMPDGSFSLYTGNYSIWSSSGFFQITVGFGPLSFAQAKAIDICFDMVVGRGGQVILTYISWRVFAYYFYKCMDSKPITYHSFVEIFIRREASLHGIQKISRDFFFSGPGHRLRSWLAMIFIMFTMIFMLVWPTITSAMSGYTPALGSFIQDTNGSMYRYTSFMPLVYTIQDGSRINLEDQYRVTMWDADTSHLGSAYYADIYQKPYNSPGFYHSTGSNEYYESGSCLSDKTCSILAQVSSYVATFRCNPRPNITSSWNETYGSGELKKIEAPTLNITSYRVPEELVGCEFSDPVDYSESQVQHATMSFVTGFSDQVYSIDYLQENGLCQPIADTFQWGVSFLQVFIMLLIAFLWSLGIFIMWVRSYVAVRCSPEHARVPKFWKSLLVLAVAMGEELARAGFEATALTDAKLEKHIRRDLQGGALSFHGALGLRKDGGSRSWFRRNKRWFVIWVLSAVPPCCFIMASRYMTVWFATTSAGVLIALVALQGNKSRTFLVACCFVLGAIIAGIVESTPDYDF